MNRLKAWVRAFFGFSRTETHAFLILLPLMAALIFGEPIYQHWFTHQPQDYSREEKKLDSLLAVMRFEKKDSLIEQPKKIQLFYFNPNRISADSLEFLGLNQAIAKRIVNYRNKGGKFYALKDLKKMYGMDSAWLQKIAPYLLLPIRVEKKNEIKTTTIPKSVLSLDVNLADTTQLKSVYGIGSKLSVRIIAYRNKLGGFISMDQLKEVYGLDSLVVKEMKKKFSIAPGFRPIQIDLNKDNEKELASHPYIKSKLAQAIVAFRHQHGAFQHLEDVKKITILKEEVFEKIKPYLSVNP